MFFFNLTVSQLTIRRPPLLRNGRIYMKDAQSAGMNEKTILLFLQVLFLSQGRFCSKNAQCSDTNFLVHDFFLCDFSFLGYGRYSIQHS